MLNGESSDSFGNRCTSPRAAPVPAGQPRSQPPFHVVSTTKVVLLSIATFGLYSIYWFWRHWALHKLDRGLKLQPLLRALFAVFFAHALNREIDYRLQRDGIACAWRPGSWATAYVASVLLVRVISRTPDTVLPSNLCLGLLLIPLTVHIVALVQVQRAANLACGDAMALQNNRLTAGNWGWLALGGVAWLLILAGVLLPS